MPIIEAVTNWSSRTKSNWNISTAALNVIDNKCSVDVSLKYSYHTGYRLTKDHDNHEAHCYFWRLLISIGCGSAWSRVNEWLVLSQRRQGCLSDWGCLCGWRDIKSRLISDAAFRFRHSLTLHARSLMSCHYFPNSASQFLTSVNQLATLFSPSQGLIHKVHGQ